LRERNQTLDSRRLESYHAKLLQMPQSPQRSDAAVVLFNRDTPDDFDKDSEDPTEFSMTHRTVPT